MSLSEIDARCSLIACGGVLDHRNRSRLGFEAQLSFWLRAVVKAKT